MDVGGSWDLDIIRTYNRAQINVDNNSTFSITHNSIVISNVNVGSFFLVYILRTRANNYNPSAVDNNSTFSISNNSIVASNVNVGAYCWLFALSSFVSVDNNSTLSVSHNTMQASNGSVSTFLDFGVYNPYYHSSAINIDTHSFVSVSHNTMIAYNMSVTGNWRMYTLYINSYFAPISIDNTSTFAIYNNNMVVSFSTGSLYIALLYSAKSNITVNGDMVIGGNTINLQGHTGTLTEPPSMLFADSDAAVNGLGRMSFHHNSIVGGGGDRSGSMMNFKADTLGPAIPTIQTCRNYAEASSAH